MTDTPFLDLAVWHCYLFVELSKSMGATGGVDKLSQADKLNTREIQLIINIAQNQKVLSLCLRPHTHFFRRHILIRWHTQTRSYLVHDSLEPGTCVASVPPPLLQSPFSLIPLPLAFLSVSFLTILKYIWSTLSDFLETRIQKKKNNVFGDLTVEIFWSPQALHTHGALPGMKANHSYIYIKIKKKIII